MSVVSAFLVPGSPLPLVKRDNPCWGELASAMEAAGERLRASKPDAVLLYSTQWLAVLDELWQTRERSTGVHVDENWHEYGDLPFDIRADHELAEACVAAVTSAVVRSKEVDYDQFPIDTGTIVAANIATGTITTDLMTAGTINADRLSAGSITTALMTANTIDGDRIRIGEGLAAGDLGQGLLGKDEVPWQVAPPRLPLAPGGHRLERRQLGRELVEAALEPVEARSFVAEQGGVGPADHLHWAIGLLKMRRIAGEPRPSPIYLPTLR